MSNALNDGRYIKSQSSTVQDSKAQYLLRKAGDAIEELANELATAQRDIRRLKDEMEELRRDIDNHDHD